MEEEAWGPLFEEYSIREFEPRRHISRPQAGEFYQKYQVFPLVTLENSIRELDSRDPRGFHDDMVPIGFALQGLNQYSKLNNNCPIFKYYYGLVCIRHVIQNLCLLVLEYEIGGEQLPDVIPDGTSWGKMSQAVAFEAMNTVVDAMDDGEIFEMFCETITKYYTRGDQELGRGYSLLLVHMLWKDRGSFLTLCSRGLLPGCAVLLLVTFRLLPMNSNETSTRQIILFLKDLTFRLYLVGSQRDRQILQFMCVPALEKIIPWEDKFNSFLNTLDSRAVRQAFSRLVYTWQQVDSNFNQIPLIFLHGLLKFVLRLLAADLGATSQEQIDLIRTALELFWLMFERRGRYLWADYHSEFRLCGIEVFSYITFAQKDRLVRPKDHSNFLQMISDVEFVGLIGRILLLTGLSNSYDSMFANTEHLEKMLKNLPVLDRSTNNATLATPQSYDHSYYEWAKTLEQCETQRNLLLGSTPDRQAIGFAEQMKETWARYGKSLNYDHSQVRTCASPRCPLGALSEDPWDARHVCGRCEATNYCNSRCQQAHWQLNTSESHTMKCESL